MVRLGLGIGALVLTMELVRSPVDLVVFGSLALAALWMRSRLAT